MVKGSISKEVSLSLGDLRSIVMSYFILSKLTAFCLSFGVLPRKV